MDTLIANYDIKNITTQEGTTGWTLMWTTTGGGLVTEHGDNSTSIVKALETAKRLDGSEFEIILGEDIVIED